MNTVLPPTSVAVMTAEKLAESAQLLTTLTVTPDERAVVLDALRRTCESLAIAAERVAQDVVDATPPGGQLGTRDGWLPAPAVLVAELSNVSARLAEAQDGFEDAGKAVAELATEQAAEEPFDRLAAADMTPAQQEAYAVLAARLDAQYGGTR
ncbi:hypothetical protein FHR32_005066 [Streptosporangium album]|uniref:Uncharacterized protein n=1 Tax=Streptosporangium album TaxID=47479 RepID=A0A7W7RYN4_9ACTN|nr:hypothetical protein [Streptosporangium album]MBB4940689.1 hypothetical protein [Streptosporangium album]